MTTMLEPGTAPVTGDPFDLDIEVVPTRTTAQPGQVWNSGTNCHTDDGCGQTCESACSNSCTDGG
ncbi:MULTISPECIES: FxLD family lanthipeptide [Saccharothrix]|uniref:FxLD family lanthipeptide n=1 Tax=Saccharothrix TaxID=2071 RepID=UPI001160EE29|nr:FxLD family lanthipeptide [Saccharothrix sp. CB00851]